MTRYLRSDSGRNRASSHSHNHHCIIIVVFIIIIIITIIIVIIAIIALIQDIPVVIREAILQKIPEFYEILS